MNTQSPSMDRHDIRVVMINSDGYYLSLTPDAIIDIQIEENLTRWWSQGYIDIRNTHDFIERSAPAGGRVEDLGYLDKETFKKGQTDSLYVFRNDGTDLMLVQFQLPEAKNDHFHQFQSMFNVYDVQEINTTGGQATKIKRLMIRDERYQRMIQTNLPWSTTIVSGASPTAMRQGLSSRSVKTGNAIKYLLQLALGEETPFAARWDEGSASTMYSSPANYNCIDDLNYLLRDHVSSADIGQGQGVLFFDRPNDVWRLVNMELLFHHAARYSEEHSLWLAGALQTEQFKLLTHPDQPTISEESPHTRVPVGGDRVYQNYDLGHRSQITALEFHEINSSDNLNNVVTTPVHLYNKKNKKFHIKQSENSIDAIYNRLTSIVDYTPRADSKATSSVSVDINALRKLNTNIKHVHTTVTEKDGKYLNSGINAAIYKSIMLSNAVEFTVPGHPSRGVGRFVSVKSETESQHNFGSAYHDKVFGQYLVTSVVHRYNNSEYSNTVVGVKPYNYQPVHNTTESEPETLEQFEKFDTDSKPEGMSLGDFFNNQLP